VAVALCGVVVVPGAAVQSGVVLGYTALLGPQMAPYVLPAVTLSAPGVDRPKVSL
jgi:hypothetical protein